MHFDFNRVDGTTVTDPSSGITAKLIGAAKVETVGKYQVVNLGNNTGYLNLTSATGALLKSMHDFTLSACYRIDDEASLEGNGYFLWSFSTTTANTQTAGRYLAYRLNAQRMAASKAGWGAESGMEMGYAADKGRWTHVLYRQSGANGELWVDGRRVAQNSQMPTPKEVFMSTPSYCWMGRAPFSGDNYLKQTLVADVRLYDVALSNQQVAELASIANDLEREYNYGTPGDFTALQAKVEECRTFAGGDLAGFAPNAVAELQDVINQATEELQAARASQQLIDQYVKKLTTLLANAKATSGYAAKRVFPVTEDHGFVHPGGLVTQADIDRAKRLIFEEKDPYMVRAWDILCTNQYAQANSASWPTPAVQRGLAGDNYMNAARGAAVAYQNALRWKISGDRAFADHAVETLMNWCNITEAVTGNTNISLAAGLYGYGFANAAELMRDYDGWSRDDFERFKEWMVRVWYNPSIDFLRRRHDTWMNFRHPNCGERPGHYWSNWGLCNVLCVMSIGILCDDVHMYNQGVSFYKYDHQGTFVEDRTKTPMIFNDGCNEFIGNLVPIMMPDERGPLGYLGQMQESGRDQGHTVMALCCALDVCQIGFNQGDDLYAYMNDRIAAGCEYVCAINFAGIAGADLPWYPYEYADCAGTRGASWQMFGPNEGGKGERRPNWDRIRGYYEGLRGVRLQYADKAAAMLCPDGGGGNYNVNSGGFDHLGFSSLANYRPLIDQADAITPLGGDIVYKGETLRNQTNLGGLKYKYWRGPSAAIPADGADITLIPQLPEGVEDSGNWQWTTGEQTRQITVRADHSYIYRVTYTAHNGAKSTAAFAIAVSGDAAPDPMTNEITVDGTIHRNTEMTVLSGKDVILYAGATTGWTDDYLWDNGQTTSVITVPSIASSRTYTCQYANQSGAVSESRFHINVVPAQQYISVGSGESEGSEVQVLAGTNVTLRLLIPASSDPDDIHWSDGSHGAVCNVAAIEADTQVTATFEGNIYTFNIYVKATDYSYYDLLTAARGYKLVSSIEELTTLAANHYFVLASDQADLLIGLKDAPLNGNKALFFETPTEPTTDLTKVFTIEPYGDAFCLRNIDYDGLLLQTEWDRPDQLRTHDQPLACEWTRMLLAYTNSSWTVENGRYPGNWLGLWTPANGYRDGEEIACNKNGDDIARLQLFAIEKARFHADMIAAHGEPSATNPIDLSPLLVNQQFVGNGLGWTMTGTWGNQRYNGAVEVWHSTDFHFTQTISGLPTGLYTVTCQMANGEGNNTGYLYASSGNTTEKATVSQSAAGSNFDAERDKMGNNPKYGLLSVDITVEDGTLTLGIREPSSDNTWLVWDNFTITYKGIINTGIATAGITHHDTAPAIYDLSGRRLTDSRAMPRGVYIINGKKHLR